MGDLFERLPQLWTTITRVLISPASNMKVALLLYATIAVFLLLILVTGLMLIMSAPAGTAAGPANSGARPTVRRRARAATPMTRQMRLLLGLGIVAVLVAVWVVAGSTTSDPGLCKSCHWPASAHATADTGKDPHAKVGCVACHESSGIIGRYVTGVPFRLVHLAMSSAGAGNEAGYGAVPTSACSSCHATSLTDIATNAERGLRMSHAEPLTASAVCIDCHRMSGGIVSVHNAGMKPCLRCHDGSKASSACATCHEGPRATAARARTTSLQSEQIDDVSCSGCHNEKRDCDPCHGLRMPHTTEFKLSAHARAAAVDVWYGSGKVCGRCHTASRNPCVRCHSDLIGRAHGNWMAAGHQGAASDACNTCHVQYAPIVTRDFCKDVCHSPAAMASSPR